jgi:nitroreductase
MESILELAKWAPSGDNTQPWRFEIIDAQHVNVHGFDTRKDCVYDFQGHASHIALGALLENIALAASGFGHQAEIQERPGCPDDHPVYEVQFNPAPGMQPDPLRDQIRLRSVQRRPYRTTPLTLAQKAALSKAPGPDYELRWLESFSDRMAMAGLVSAAGKLRLTIPEAYTVHTRIIAWNAQFSEDRVPDQAIGLDALSLRLMRWVLGSWARVDFFNTYLAGTLSPRIQLDIIPSLACAAHFFLLSRTTPSSVADYVASGRAMQRLWLTATQLGLQLQPEMSPLIFRNYAVRGESVSIKPGARQESQNITNKFNRLAGGERNGDRAVFMGRIGSAPVAQARSLRLTLDRLMQ